MGLIEGIMGVVFGGGRNAVAETVEIFRENAEKGAERDAAMAQAALAQFAAEFALPKKSLFDRVIDGLNRVPRPAMAIGTLGLFASAMFDPIWFAARMQGIGLVPEPLWWLLGAVVSFYFGARHQAKTQEFQSSIAQTLARAPEVTSGLGALRALRSGAGEAPKAVATETEALGFADNPALQDWRRKGE